jgi:hypothetical protein
VAAQGKSLLDSHSSFLFVCLFVILLIATLRSALGTQLSEWRSGYKWRWKETHPRW